MTITLWAAALASLALLLCRLLLALTEHHEVQRGHHRLPKRRFWGAGVEAGAPPPAREEPEPGGGR